MEVRNPLPLILNPPTPPNIKYSQYIVIYHIRRVGGFNVRGGVNPKPLNFKL